MTNIDTRQEHRDSLFLLAQLRVGGQEAPVQVKVRNLSPSGMMAEGGVTVSRGMLVSVELRNVGWVDGTVAWKQGDRLGIAFLDEIDPGRALEPQAIEEGFEPPRFARGTSVRSSDLRKI